MTATESSLFSLTIDGSVAEYPSPPATCVLSKVNTLTSPPLTSLPQIFLTSAVVRTLTCIIEDCLSMSTTDISSGKSSKGGQREISTSPSRVPFESISSPRMLFHVILKNAEPVISLHILACAS